MARVEVPAWLEEVADRDLYRRNAFRISGLAVTATPRAVRRRVSEVRAAEALGAEQAEGGPAQGRWLPLVPAPDHVAVREALRRLEDPVRRVVDEFFWFWPLQESDGTGLMEAREIWRRLVKSPARADAGHSADPGARSIAVHNLAVLHHAETLEANQFIGNAGGRTLWQRAYRHWRMVLDDDGCWRWLDERIRVLDDPRLRAVSGTAFRETLPAVLLEIHAGIAMEAAQRPGREEAARQHVSLMRDFGTDDGTVDAVLRRATAPIAAAIRRRNEATPGPGEDPATLERAAASLLDETKPDLRVLRALLGAGHPVTEGAADAVASEVNACAVACANSVMRDESAVRDPKVTRAIAHLRSARELAASGHVRAPIEQNLVVLLSNEILLACKEAVEQGERSPSKGAQQASRLLDDAQPRLRELRELRRDAPETDEVHDTVAMAACRLLGGYFKSTRDFDKCLTGYRRTLQVAVSEQGRSVIRQNIDTLTREKNAQAFAAEVVPTLLRSRTVWGDDPLSCMRCGRPLRPSDGLPDGRPMPIPHCAACRSEVQRHFEALVRDQAPPPTAARSPGVTKRALITGGLDFAAAGLAVSGLAAGLGSSAGRVLVFVAFLLVVIRTLIPGKRR
ncbi:hypothetical protein [Nonomuraea sp. NPDC049400]|uniref:hypothetical protein n=1 Tax=Nonomuraea sp. NPDC049400 TaxID=3364352 RepID=UPI00379537D6